MSGVESKEHRRWNLNRVQSVGNAPNGCRLHYPSLCLPIIQCNKLSNT